MTSNNLLLLLALLFVNCDKEDYFSDEIANNQLTLEFEFKGETISICQDAPWLFSDGPCESGTNYFEYHSQMLYHPPDPSVLIEIADYRKTAYSPTPEYPQFYLYLDSGRDVLNGRYHLHPGSGHTIRIHESADELYTTLSGEIKIKKQSRETFLSGPGRIKGVYRYVEGEFNAVLENGGSSFPIQGRFILSNKVEEIQ